MADVPTTIMQVALELCRKHESSVPMGIGSPNITVSDLIGDSQSGHIGGAFSMAELTAVLYEDYDIGGEDKLILSR